MATADVRRPRTTRDFRLGLPWHGIRIDEEYGGASSLATQAYISRVQGLRTHGAGGVEVRVLDRDEEGRLGAVDPEPDGDFFACDLFVVRRDLARMRRLPDGDRVLAFLDVLHEGVHGLATIRGWEGVDQLVAAREHWGDVPFTSFTLEVERKRCRLRPLTAVLLAVFSLEGMAVVTVVRDDDGREVARSRSLLTTAADLGAHGSIPVRVVWRDARTLEMGPKPRRVILHNPALEETVRLVLPD